MSRTLRPAPNLEHPFDAAPDTGTATEVAPGLHWACMPLPFRLDHVNLWLLRGKDGWSVIDTGCDTSTIRAAWETLLAGPMADAPLDTLIATHGHVDHIGLAGWLTQRSGADFVSTFAEWVWARLAHTRDMPETRAAHLAFLHRHGVDESTAGHMASGRDRFVDMATDLPGAIREIRAGQTLRMGGRDWRVIVTGGHAFEHAAFYCARDNILIAGDHLLPRISPVIAVFEMIPDADPLGDFLDSFHLFDDIPADALVLPSHGLPYYGVHRRIAELRAHHAVRLDAALALLDRPRTALDLSRALFPHIDGADDTAFALGETVAHLNRLVRERRAEEQRDADGVSRFVRRKEATR